MRDPPANFSLLNFNTSLRNTTLDCHSLGIHYTFSTPTDGIKTSRTTTITKWDASMNSNVAVAQWERNTFSTDRLRMRSLTSDQFVAAGDVLQRKRGWTTKWVFVGRNGRRYSWKRNGSNLKLYDDGSDDLIAKSHDRRYIFRPRKGYIEVFSGGSQYCDILDEIVVTWALVEHKRRKDRSASAASAGAAASG